MSKEKIEKDSPDVKNAKHTSQRTSERSDGKNDGKGFNKKKQERKSDFVKKVIQMRRVATVRAGGTMLKQSVLCALGDENNKVGIAHAKSAISNAEASIKAYNRAKKKMFQVKFGANKSITHDISNVKFGASRVSIKRAPVGTGLICGAKIRPILSMAGYKNIVVKLRGGSVFNQVQALQKALKSCITPKTMRSVYPDFDLCHPAKQKPAA
jgi:small subunit ribosomal protein S5